MPRLKLEPLAGYNARMPHTIRGRIENRRCVGTIHLGRIEPDRDSQVRPYECALSTLDPGISISDSVAEELGIDVDWAGATGRNGGSRPTSGVARLAWAWASEEGQLGGGTGNALVVVNSPNPVTVGMAQLMGGVLTIDGPGGAWELTIP